MRISIGLCLACLLLGGSGKSLTHKADHIIYRTFQSLPAEANVSSRLDVIDPTTGPNDPEFKNQYYYKGIGVLTMWSRGITGLKAARPITIAVIDTGVTLTHSDLISNLVPGYDFALFSYGVGPRPPPIDISKDSHGTMVAGVIGARTNNNLGVAGIGGGDALAGVSGLRIMPLRISLQSTSKINCAASAKAIDYATTHGATIINMSYAGYDFCQAEFEAIQRAYTAGLVLVAGAGNDDTSIRTYPAAYGSGPNDRLVIAVTGVYSNGLKADDANYGSWVDVNAPFWGFRSTTRQGYGTASGTSYATALVSGLIGLLMSNDGLTRDEAVARILSTADSVDGFNPDYQGLLGVGRINADRATHRATQ